MAAQNPSRRHHHAPQFYLRPWTAADGCLWRYSRAPNGKLCEDRKSPKSVGFEFDLYATTPTTPFERWPVDIVEKQVMAPLDDAAARVHSKLTALEPTTDLSDDERVSWARFLNSLMERHPRELAERDAAAVRIATELCAEYRHRWPAPADQARVEAALANYDHEATARNTVRTAMVQEIRSGTFLDHVINEHEWMVFAPVEGAFITSDRPLIVNGGDTQTRPVHWVTLALGPQHLFVSHPRAWLAEPDRLKEQLATTALIHNMLIVFARPAALFWLSIRFGGSAALPETVSG